MRVVTICPFVLALALAMPALAQQYPLDGIISEVPNDGPAERLPESNGGAEQVDPTKNVLDLVRAESKYQDATREGVVELFKSIITAEIKRIDEAIAASALHSMMERESSERRADDLREMAVIRANDLRDYAEKLTNAQLTALQREADIRAEAEEKIRAAETERINKIREVDAAATAASVLAASERAKELALRVEQSATVLSDAVSSAAAAATENLNRVEGRIAESLANQSVRITTLEQSASVTQGRGLVADPALLALEATVERLDTAITAGAGKQEGSANTIGFILGGLGLLFGLIGAIAAVVAFARPRPHPNP